MKKILILLIALVLIYAGITYAINTFLPEKIETAVSDFIEENLQKEVTISKTTISLIQGIFFKNITIYEKNKKDIYLKADKITIRPLYAAFLYTKKVFLNVHIQGAYLKLIKDTSGKTNLPPIQISPEGQNIFFIKNINIKNLTLDFKDLSNRFKKKLTGINIKTSLSLKGLIDLEAKWQKHLFLTANYKLKAGQLKGSATLNDIDLAELNPFFKGITVKSALLNTARFTFEVDKGYAIKGKAKIERVDIIKDDLIFSGDLELSPTLILQEDKDDFEYTLAGRVSNGKMENIPYVGSLSDTTATFTLNKNSLNISSLKTRIFDKIFDLSSNIDYSQYPDYLLTAQSTLPLKQLIYLAKKIHPFSFDYEREGNIKLQLILKGNMEEKTQDYLINYDITGCSFDYIEKLDAKGYLKKDLLTITKGKLYYKGTPFDLTAELTDFSSAQLSFNIKNEPLSLKADAIYSKDKIDINELLLNGPNTDIKATAQIDSKKNPMLIIEGKGVTDFLDIRKVLILLKAKPSIFDKLNPRGKSNLKFTVNGNSDIDLWQVKLNFQSDRLKIYNLESRNITVKLYRDENEIIINPLTAKFAQGKIKCLGQFNLPDNFGQANILVNDVDLSYIRDGLELEDSELSGKLSLEAFIESDDLRNFGDLGGEGIIEVKKGNIWEISFFEGLGKFLFIPDFEKISFEEGYSDISFKGRDIIFENLELNSRKMDLSGAGKINLDDTIHFMFFPQFNPRLVASSEGLKKVTTEFLGKSGLLIEVQGTLEEPTYEMKPLFLSPLDKIKRFFENISG